MCEHNSRRDDYIIPASNSRPRHPAQAPADCRRASPRRAAHDQPRDLVLDPQPALAALPGGGIDVRSQRTEHRHRLRRLGKPAGRPRQVTVAVVFPQLDEAQVLPRRQVPAARSALALGRPRCRRCRRTARAAGSRAVHRRTGPRSARCGPPGRSGAVRPQAA